MLATTLQLGGEVTRPKAIIDLPPVLDRARLTIVALLRLKRRSQTALGRAVGISKNHVSEMCAGKRGFPIEKLDEIARVLDVPTYRLFMDDPSQWTGLRDRRKGQRRSGLDRRRPESAIIADFDAQRLGDDEEDDDPPTSCTPPRLPPVVV